MPLFAVPLFAVFACRVEARALNNAMESVCLTLRDNDRYIGCTSRLQNAPAAFQECNQVLSGRINLTTLQVDRCNSCECKARMNTGEVSVSVSLMSREEGNFSLLTLVGHIDDVD